MTTSETDLKLGLTNVPVRPNRMLEVDFQFLGLDGFAVGKNAIFYFKVAWDGGSLFTYGRTFWQSSTSISPPPYGRMLIYTPSSVSTMAVSINGNVDTGSSGVYRYSPGNGQDNSFITLKDIGTALHYNEQL
jgi:hypothetical protein